MSHPFLNFMSITHSVTLNDQPAAHTPAIPIQRYDDVYDNITKYMFYPKNFLVIISLACESSSQRCVDKIIKILHISILFPSHWAILTCTSCCRCVQHEILAWMSGARVVGHSVENTLSDWLTDGRMITGWWWKTKYFNVIIWKSCDMAEICN